MLKRSIITALFVTCGVSHAGDMSHSAVYGLSSGIVSVGSSALVSGIILSPVMLPAALVMKSVEKDDRQQTAYLTAIAPQKKEIEMVVPLRVVEEGNLKAGDKVSLESAPEGTGALLKKGNKVLTHMVNEENAGLSGSRPVPTK
ncbi:STM0539 family protein [Pluralibacter gergoviae]|uniref:STM0539 family protein n=1 Tax=Pluralibacter gergoviae TaxID=61647 RepID=UPI000A38373F|nr:STM0539 family protein [Pluralibacter gergoviae]EKT9642875.1 STM0539 family protein [Pluralibacter gergoviae]EKV3545884.1 STM0539 family protein [Pluralibacter gergoviae]EKV9901229.1 STM0539 family protein [Pluralibacter gergoviae]EKV9932884.1 STM0539 family protein [Pluralibacter gergoviae]EKW9977959.1 STM0539 family protein [Pluralibacter gergoviae]